MIEFFPSLPVYHRRVGRGKGAKGFYGRDEEKDLSTLSKIGEYRENL